MRYLLILLMLAGCSGVPKYQIGSKVKAGNCVGYIGAIVNWGWPNEPHYHLVPVKCGPIYYNRIVVDESEINEVL